MIMEISKIQKLLSVLFYESTCIGDLQLELALARQLYFAILNMTSNFFKAKLLCHTSFPTCHYGHFIILSYEFLIFCLSKKKLIVIVINYKLNILSDKYSLKYINYFKIKLYVKEN